ncbi:MAG TPA: MFS transporter [Phycisphaerae bacterium]|nr:MFS transporter [Phycisphaerae bacterium]HRR85986.1 MFS transporter [Phycisphaerae bacterium]
MASLFSDMSHETVTAALPAYLASMGAAAGALGTIEGFADGFSSIAKLYGGWLADRLRRRKVLCAGGYGFMAFSPVVIALATNWFIVLGGRVLAWVSRGVRTPPRKALLADAVTPTTYGRAFGFERAMDTTGAIIAPIAVLLLLRVGLTHRGLILLSTIPAVLAVFAITLLVRERKDRTPIRTPFLQSFGGFNSRFKEFLGAVGLFGLGDFADTFYILYAVTVLSPDIGPGRAATLSVAGYTLHNVLYASWSYLGGWMADRTNKRLLLVAGYMAAALAAACMVAGVRSYAGLAIMFALGGTGVGLYEAVEDAVAAELLPSGIRGSGFGALAVVTGIGDLVSSVVVGWLWTGFGIEVGVTYALVLMLAGAGFMLYLAGRRVDHGNHQ